MSFSPDSPAFGPTLGYAVNTIDRLSARRDDPALWATLRDEPDSATLVFVGEQVLLTDNGPWLPVAAADALGAPEHMALLGRRGSRALFATALPAARAETTTQPGHVLADLRAIAVAGSVTPEDVGAMAQAKALFHWHRQHGFCAHCGSRSAVESMGWRRMCPACGALHFPRTDPVVIMMATDGERCLLGRQPRFPPGMYSCLAGFLEPGETIEDAVRRELGEEAGIAVGAVRYLGSQPWPFPASLMIGCIAEAATTALTIDTDELEEARWVSRADTRAILEGRHADGLVCPPTMAIANHLMRAWAYETA